MQRPRAAPLSERRRPFPRLYSPSVTALERSCSQRSTASKGSPPLPNVHVAHQRAPAMPPPAIIPGLLPPGRVPHTPGRSPRSAFQPGSGSWLRLLHGSSGPSPPGAGCRPQHAGAACEGLCQIRDPQLPPLPFLSSGAESQGPLR